MSEAYSPADIALFADLDRAVRALDVVPCLIGAGAIRLGGDTRWRVRLARVTRDWDFAVRADSWSQLEELAGELTGPGGSFERTGVLHRFRHGAGGQLDIVPYGGVELSPGTIRWPDGTEMTTLGLHVLDEHHETLHLDEVAVRTASIPAVVGLKLLAYLDRRPGIVRDIQDVHAILRGAQDSISDERIVAEALPQLASGEVAYSDVGAYVLGRDVGRVFQEDALAPMRSLLDRVEDERDRTAGDALAGRGVLAERERIVRALRALGAGLRDR